MVRALPKLLLITHSYIPNFSSGVLRVRGFVSSLRERGWDCHVLTRQADGEFGPEIGKVHQTTENEFTSRAFGFDSKRVLGIKGRTLELFCYPDQYISWFFDAVRKAILIVNRSKTDVICSTFPVPTSHLIGWTVSKFCRKPWVADFRDPMVQEGYPADGKKRAVWRWIENGVARNANHLLFTTEAALRYYKRRYPFLDEERLHFVPNGFDETDFCDKEPDRKEANSRVRFIHAGTVYDSERDPTHLFEGLRQMLDKGGVNHQDLSLDFYGFTSPRSVGRFSEMIRGYGLEKVVRFLPGLQHADMIEELYKADVLLVMQAENCDFQIPAKIYEYFRIGKPILALTTTAGETGRVILDNNAGMVVPLNDAQEIARGFEKIAERLKAGRALPQIPKDTVQKFSRRRAGEQFAEILEECIYRPRGDKKGKGVCCH